MLSVHLLACGYTAIGQQNVAAAEDGGAEDAADTADTTAEATTIIADDNDDDDGAGVDAWAFRATKRVGEHRYSRPRPAPVT